jgi:hypothetical protein
MLERERLRFQWVDVYEGARKRVSIETVCGQRYQRLYEPTKSLKSFGLYGDAWSHLSDAGMMGHSAVA